MPQRIPCLFAKLLDTAPTMRDNGGMTNHPTNEIDTLHCEGCGSTDAEDLYTGDQGYTACCNEPVVIGCRTCTH